MNNSGDAAEQIVRMSLEGVNVAARITGSAAKEIALLLLAALKSPEKNTPGKLKLKGKERLTSMLKSGKPLEIFSVKERDLKKFMQGAKQYGIVYCVLRNAKNNRDGLCDIMVKADDAPKISRLIERFKLATVDKAKIKNEDENVESKTEKSNETIDLELLNDENEFTGIIPFFTEDLPTRLPSEPISDSKKTPEKATLSKKSVKDELRDITASKKAKEAESTGRNEIPLSEKPKNTPTTTHIQPKRGKSMSVKSKRTR